jgi:hypothetical protein
MSLARASDDPTYKQRYEDLALAFAQSAACQRGFDIAVPPVTAVKRTPDSGSTSQHKVVF